MNLFELLIFLAVILLCLELREAWFATWGLWSYPACFALGIALLATLLFTIDRVANRFEHFKTRRKR